MKVIDLLNKIANEEEVPRKIKWGEFELEWEELGYHDYKFLGTGNHLLFQGFATSVLNDEVEIIEDEPRNIEVCENLFTRSEYNRLAGIEEDKKIEKLDIDLYFTEGGIRTAKKINEIIDKINKEDK